MAERSIEAELEGQRREAVKAIAQGGTQALNITRNVSSALKQGARSVMGDQTRAAGGDDGLAAELQAILAPALSTRAGWSARTTAFERADTADRMGSARDFFAGAKTALPIVQADADARRAGAEAELLNQVLQQELQAGQMTFGLRQAIEQRQAAREAQAFQQEHALRQQAFQEQAHREQLAMQQQALAFQEAEARRLSMAAAGPPPAPARRTTTVSSRRGRSNFGSGGPRGGRR